LWSRERDFHWFMLSWPFKICFWKFICKQIKILTKFWRWFHSKRMHHLFLINFLKSVLSYASCSVRIAHCFYNIYHFFSICFFELILFFCLFSNTSVLQNPEAQNFLKQNSQHRVMQNRGFCKSEKKSKIYQKKNTMELVKWNLCRSKHKYELKLKIKSTKG